MRQENFRRRFRFSTKKAKDRVRENDPASTIPIGTPKADLSRCLCFGSAPHLFSPNPHSKPSQPRTLTHTPWTGLLGPFFGATLSAVHRMEASRRCSQGRPLTYLHQHTPPFPSDFCRGRGRGPRAPGTISSRFTHASLADSVVTPESGVLGPSFE